MESVRSHLMILISVTNVSVYQKDRKYFLIIETLLLSLYMCLSSASSVIRDSLLQVATLSPSLGSLFWPSFPSQKEVV